MIYRPQPDGRIFVDAETIATIHRITSRHARRQHQPIATDLKTRAQLYLLPEPAPMSYHAM